MDKRIHNRSRVRVLSCMAGITIATATQAATCIVNSATDDPGDASAKVTAVDSASWSGANAGVITLRDCIVAANLMTGATGVPTEPGMSITFDAAVFTSAENATIVLASDLPLLFNNTTVDASGLAVPITIDGGNAQTPGQGFRAFFVSGLPAIPNAGLPDPDGAQAIAVTLANLTIRNTLARGGSSYFGGGGMGAGSALFVNKLASVALDHVGFATNTAAAGNSLAAGGSESFGGGGMGAAVVQPSGGGAGMARVQGAYASGNGIGTASDDAGGGGFGGSGIGQISNAQGFASPNFNGGAYLVVLDGGNGGIGGGGGAAGDASGGETRPGDGGFGGGGGRANYTIFGPPAQYSGGKGGFGGGGGQGTRTSGGDGGFGGGGGGSDGVGGHGGFGGGGGGHGVGGVGGGGGPNPIDSCTADYGFGGGAAFGGAVFVRSGAALTIRNGVAHMPTAIEGNDVIPSTGVNEGSNPGAAAGRGMFLMTGATTTFDIDGRYTIADNIADDSPSALPGPCYMPGDGAGAALTKSGTGLLELSAPDYRYLGATAINAGVLRLTGTIWSDAFVAPGAALAGNGFSASVANSGMLVPGTPADAWGTLTASGDVNFNGGSALCIHADATGASSHLSVGGNVNLGGVVRFEFASTPPAGTTYSIVTAANAAGAFDGFETSDPGVGGVFDYQFATMPASVSFRVIASDAIFRNDFDGTSANAGLCAAAFAE